MSAHSDLAQINAELRASWTAGALKTEAQRVRVLEAVRACVHKHFDGACAALLADLGRNETEARGELEMVVAEIDAQIAGLKGGWMNPEPRTTHLLLAPAHTEVRREPFGVCLVMSPFNYPMNLALTPVVGALAAGNTVLLKPSEQTAACEQWFLTCLGQSPGLRHVLRVVAGGVPRTTALLALKFDFIFFTGSPAVGRVVSRAAAEHLTPTVMELGGKAPAVVCQSVASVRECAKRIAFGKWLNAGQTCMAPDYVLVHHTQRAALVAALQDAVNEFYGPHPEASADYGRLCTEAHAARLVELVAASDGVVRCGGAAHADPARRYVPPTIVDGPSPTSPLMTNEIFGPVLPVLPFGGDGCQEAVALVNRIDAQPLAAYVFTASSAVAEQFLQGVQSGDAMVNETFMHALSSGVPFGGVGKSGHGTYRGRLSFEAFTYPRGVVWRHGVWDIDQTTPFNCRYPPSGKGRKLLLPKMLGLLPSVPRVFVRPSARLLLVAALVAGGGFVVLDAEAMGAPPLTHAANLFKALFGR